MIELVELGEPETTGVTEAVRLADWLGVLVGLTLEVRLWVAVAVAVAEEDRLLDREIVADSLRDRVSEILRVTVILAVVVPVTLMVADEVLLIDALAVAEGVGETGAVGEGDSVMIARAT